VNPHHLVADPHAALAEVDLQLPSGRNQEEKFQI